MNSQEESLKNIIDEDTLKNHLSYIALFIGMYENFIDTIEQRVESFLCDEMNINENGTIKYKRSEAYKNLIERRKVDDLGNKNSLKATMLWFLDEKAITQKDYDDFLLLKNQRDKYVHQMTDFLWNGLEEKDAGHVMSLFDLYLKIDNWWINEIEIPIAGDEIEPGYDKDSVRSLSLVSFEVMINVLYGNKSPEYMDVLNNLKHDTA